MPEADKREELVVGLFDRGVLQFAKDKANWVKLQSSELSSHYLDHRPLLSLDQHHPTLSRNQQARLLTMTVVAYGDLVRSSIGLEGWPDHLYGVPESMTPLTPLVGAHLGLSVLWGRGMIKRHGAYASRQAIVGDYHPGEITFLLDNAITTGDSAVKEVTRLNKVGMRAVGLAVLFDLERRGIEAMTNYGVEAVAYFGLSDAVLILRENRRIDQAHIDAVNDSRVQEGYPEVEV